MPAIFHVLEVVMNNYGMILGAMAGSGEYERRSTEKATIFLNVSDTLASGGICGAFIQVPHTQGAHGNKLVANGAHVLLSAGSSSVPNL